MLSNANMDFNYCPKKTDFTKEIKTWLNRLIIECKIQLPVFRKKMKKIFLNSNTDGTEDKKVSFMINSKIK